MSFSPQESFTELNGINVNNASGRRSLLMSIGHFKLDWSS